MVRGHILLSRTKRDSQGHEKPFQDPLSLLRGVMMIAFYGVDGSEIEISAKWQRLRVNSDVFSIEEKTSRRRRLLVGGIFVFDGHQINTLHFAVL